MHSYFTGNSNVIHLSFKWLSISQTSYDSVSISLFNKLPYTPVNVSFKTFKNLLRSWLIKNLFYSLGDIFDVILKKYVLSTVCVVHSCISDVISLFYAYVRPTRRDVLLKKI